MALQLRQHILLVSNLGCTDLSSLSAFITIKGCSERNAARERPANPQPSNVKAPLTPAPAVAHRMYTYLYPSMCIILLLLGDIDRWHTSYLMTCLLLGDIDRWHTSYLMTYLLLGDIDTTQLLQYHYQAVPAPHDDFLCSAS